MSEQQKALVELKNAGVQTSERWLVRGVDLNVHEKEIVTLIGQNGSGKSKTAKMSLGIAKPTEGTVIRHQNLKVGYVPQKLAIDWTMPLTVERFMRLTEKVPDHDIEQALNLTDATRLRKSEVRNLSGGEFQRVMLARAIARKPNLLVLDEPVQGVDYTGEIKIYNLIQQIRDELKCGILLISHDLHVVMAATDHVLCLNGHVCCHGSPTVVAESAPYKELFGDQKSAALAFYNHKHDHTHLPDGRVQHEDGSITDHCHPNDGHHSEEGGCTHA